MASHKEIVKCICQGESFKPQCVDCTRGDDDHKQGCINICFDYISNAMFVECPRTMEHIKDAECRLGFHRKRLKDEGIIQSTCKRNSLLIIACKFTHFKAVKYLLTESTILTLDPQANDVDAAGNSAFHYAISSNKVPIVELLFDHWIKWPFDCLEDIIRCCKSFEIGEILIQLFNLLKIRQDTLTDEMKTFLTKEMTLRAVHYRVYYVLGKFSSDRGRVRFGNKLLHSIDIQEMLIVEENCWLNLRTHDTKLADEDKRNLVTTYFQFIATSIINNDPKVVSYFHMLEKYLMSEKNNECLWSAVIPAFKEHKFLIIGSQYNRTEVVAYLVNECQMLEFGSIMGNPCLPGDTDQHNMRAIDYGIKNSNFEMVKLFMAYWSHWPFDQFDCEATETQLECDNDMEALITKGIGAVVKDESECEGEIYKYVKEEIKFRAFSYLIQLAIKAADDSKHFQMTQIEATKDSKWSSRQFTLAYDSISKALSAFKQYVDFLNENGSSFNEAKHWILLFVAENLHNIRKQYQDQKIKDNLDEFEFTLTCMILPLVQYQELAVAHRQSRQFILESANNYNKHEKYIITEESVIEYHRSTKVLSEALAKLSHQTETRNASTDLLDRLIRQLPQPIPIKRPLSTITESNITDHQIEPDPAKKESKPETSDNKVTLRDLVYLNNIDQYIQLALSVDLKKELNFGILVIERALHVTGECFKNTKVSSHISAKGQSILQSQGIPVQVFIGLRDAMSHQKAVGALKSIEYKLTGVHMLASTDAEYRGGEVDVYLQVQKDLEKIRNFLQNAITEIEYQLIEGICQFSKCTRDSLNTKLEEYPVLREVVRSLDMKTSLLKMKNLDVKNKFVPLKSVETLLKSPSINESDRIRRVSFAFEGIIKLHSIIDERRDVKHKIDVSHMETRILYRNFLIEIRNGSVTNNKTKPKRLIKILENERNKFETKEKLLNIANNVEFSERNGKKLVKELQALQTRSISKIYSKENKKQGCNNDNKEMKNDKKELLTLCHANWSEARAIIGKIKCFYETFMKNLTHVAKGEIEADKINRVSQVLQLDEEGTSIFRDALTKFSKFPMEDNIKQKVLNVFVNGVCRSLGKTIKKKQNAITNSVESYKKSSINIDENATEDKCEQSIVTLDNENKFLDKKDIEILSDLFKKSIDIYEMNKKWIWYLRDFINLDGKEVEMCADVLGIDKGMLECNKNICKNAYFRSKKYKENNIIEHFIDQILQGDPIEKIKSTFSNWCKRLDLLKIEPLLWIACKGLLEELYNQYFKNQLDLLREHLKQDIIGINYQDHLVDKIHNNLPLKVSIEMIVFNLLNTIKTMSTYEVFVDYEKVITRCVLSAQRTHTTLPVNFRLRNELAHWNIVTNMADLTFTKLVVGTAYLFSEYGEFFKDFVKKMEKTDLQTLYKKLFPEQNSDNMPLRKLKLKHSKLFDNLKMRTILQNSIEVTLNEKISLIKTNIRPVISCDFIPKAYWNAIRENNKQKLLYCQERSGVLKAPGTNTWTLLHQATEFGNKEITEKLMNQRISSGTNLLQPLHIAALHGHHALVAFFVKNNYFSNNESYCTPLHLASMNGNIDTVKILLGVAETRRQADFRETQLSTALHLACKYGYNDIIKLLLDHNVNVDCQTDNGLTPLHLAAARKGGRSTVELLISNKANKEARAKLGEIPLHIAAREGHKGIVTLFMDKNVNVVLASTNGWTALHYAASHGRESVVDYLLEEKKIKQNLHLEDKEKETPLHCAARHGHVKICRSLINKGASVNGCNRKKYTSIHLAAENGHTKTVELLLGFKAHIDCQTDNRDTPLHLAIKNGYIETVELLLKHGASLQAKEIENKLPLELAVENGDTEAVALLVEHGADVSQLGAQLASTDDTRQVEDENSGPISSMPIHDATEQGNIEMLALILSKRLDVLHSELSDGRQAIHIAAQLNNFRILELLLSYGAMVNHQANNGKAPIHYAAENGSMSILNLLVGKQAELNNTDKNGLTPLYTAYLRGHINMMKLLVASGADINSRGCDGQPLIHHIVRKNDDRSLALLLESQSADLEASDQDGLTPLYLAYASGFDRIVSMLVNKKANLNCRDMNGQPLIHRVIANSDIRTFELLLNNGKIDTEIIDSDGLTPIYLAYQGGQQQIVKELINKNVNVNCKDSKGNFLVHSVAMKNDIETLRMLLQCESMNLNNKNSNGVTPLFLAYESNFPEIMMLLIDKKADVNCTNNLGHTLLHLAAMKDDRHTLNLLLNNGANIDIRANDKCTALHYATKSERYAIVELLLNRGADLRCLNKGGWEPFHYACKNGNMEIITLLLAKGADITCQATIGTQPIHLAAGNGQLEVVKLLIDKGADINALSKFSWTPLSFAKQNKHKQVENVLLEMGAIMMDKYNY